MTAIARLEVIPNRNGGISDAVASAVDALDEFDVGYETTPTDTVIEADDVSEVFAAAEAAHRAVPDDRLVTSLEIDETRTRRQPRQERVTSVERKLGRPAKRERQTGRGGQQYGAKRRGTARGAEPAQRGAPTQQGEREVEIQRYHGPIRGRDERQSKRRGESEGRESRYLRAVRQQ